MNIFNYIISYAWRNFFLILLILVVIISYGQTLNMSVWEDDNALFFKLGNIEEKAGFLGGGIFGEGPYKYTATFYWPVYYFFHFNTLVFFGFGLCLYFLASVFIYKLFSEVTSETAGKVSALLFGAGYMASESFIRLFNSVPASISIVLISILLLGYWRYYQRGKAGYYFLSLISYLLLIELVQSRTHYFIVIVALFELIFLTFKHPIRSVFYSIVRILPFIFLFYHYFLRHADERSGQVGKLIQSILHGEFYNTYGLIGSITNLIIPDWMMNFFFSAQISIFELTSFGAPLVKYLFLLLILGVLFLIRKLLFGGRLVFIISVLSVVFWFFICKFIFAIPALNFNEKEIFTFSLGGGSIILGLFGGFALKGDNRKWFYFLLFWLIFNIAAYSAYMPTVVYESMNRYLVHSFVAVTGIFGLLISSCKVNIFKNKLLIGFIIVWGVGNLINAVTYQNWILESRSMPTKDFYQQLKILVPQINKGDVFYFDIADDSRKYYDNAVAVSQMPQSASIGWRYGIDRADIKVFNEFDDLKNYFLENKTSTARIFSFLYSGGKIIDTTKDTRDFFANKISEPKQLTLPPHTVETAVIKHDRGSEGSQKELLINFKQPIKSSIPLEVELEIIASPYNFVMSDFPFVDSSSVEVRQNMVNLRAKDIIFDYIDSKNKLLSSSIFSTDSHWQDRVTENIIDGDVSSFWQSDRFLWKNNRRANISIDLLGLQQVGGLVLIIGEKNNNVPIRYSIETSKDGILWQIVKTVDNKNKLLAKDPQVIRFIPSETRLMRMVITETLNGDSPAIAEIWPLLFNLSSINVSDAEKFLDMPFGYLQSESDFAKIFSKLNFQGMAQLYWSNNKYRSWSTTYQNRLKIRYDHLPHKYILNIPAGGTEISQIKLTDMQVPGKVTVSGLRIRYPGFGNL